MTTSGEGVEGVEGVLYPPVGKQLVSFPSIGRDTPPTSSTPSFYLALIQPKPIPLITGLGSRTEPGWGSRGVLAECPDGFPDAHGAGWQWLTG